MTHARTIVCLVATLPALLFVWRAPSASRAADAEVARLVETIERFASDPFEQRVRAKAIRELGAMGGAQAAGALVPLFDDPFVHLRDHVVSAWIAMVRGERAEETVTWFEKKGLRHRDAGVRRGVAIALGFAPAGDVARLASARLRTERDPDVMIALLGTLARCAPPTADMNLGKVIAHKDGRVSLAAAQLLLAWSDTDGVPAAERTRLRGHRDPLGRAAAVLLAGTDRPLDEAHLDAILRDASHEPRIALAEVLHMGGPETRDLLAALLEDASWRVRAAAIETTVLQWRADLVPLLIDRLELEEGRLRLDLGDALSLYAGKDLGTDVALWRGWWKAVEDTFEVGERPAADRRRRQAPRPTEGETQAASFFRLPVLGERVAFLLDCSGSMRDPAVEDAEGGESKMEVARGELARTLEGLDDEIRFDVFLYRYPSSFPPMPEMTRALGRLEPCTARRARKAMTWLERQPVKGWGAFYDALVALIAEDVDTIYFLTDGRPSRGLYDRDFRLIDEFQKRNRFRKVVVHTVLTGRAKADRTFLEELAAVTGGHFADAMDTRRGR